jgi:uridine kinase
MSAHKDCEFSLVTQRSTVEVHLQDGRVLSGPRNCEIGNFLRQLPEADDPPIVGAIVNGELRELTYKIKMDALVKPVTMGEPDGMRIYRRSLIFLLDTACDNIIPNAILSVDHSVASGGYFCRVEGRPPLTPEELVELETAMRRIVGEDLPFTRREVPLSQVIEYFRAEGEEDKVRLLSHRKKNYLTLYELAGHRDYHHGYMVPSTGYLKWFQLVQTEDGFTLRFPRRHKPTEFSPMVIFPKLLHTFRQYRSWLSLLGISSVGALNDAIQNENIHEIMLVSEALHEQRVTEIASQIASQKERVRIIMVAGPSASGKTTFSKRLSIQLLAHGVAPFPLGMDNYFIDRDRTPRNQKGEIDFESINALDRERLTQDMQRLITGDRVRLPHYDFISGKSLQGEEVQLKSDEIIILEGIHGLNPELISDSPSHFTFRIYDTRLIRRIVRDAYERGYSALETINRWESVRRGEKRNIFPYQEYADVMFNSALVYEISVLKPLAEPLLRQVPYGTPAYVEAKRLLAFMDWFLPLESDLIPENSILREFVGKSILHDFSLWGDRGSVENQL